ncbi:MAG: hypothetical protein RLY57_561 [Candidatus Parcubacteria bacterium]|jgi:hypothetical protein
MSEKQQSTIEQLKAHQQIKTPEQLAAKKKEMVVAIQNATSPEIQRDAVKRVSCYSIDDAIEIVEALKLKDALGFLKGESEYVMHRHQHFFSALSDRMEWLANSCSDPDVSEKMERQAIALRPYSQLGDRIQVDIEPEVQKAIDEYYSVLISQRPGIKSPKTEDNNHDYSKAEQQAVDFMQTAYETIEPHMHASALTRFLKSLVVEDTDQDPREVDPWKDKNVEFISKVYISRGLFNPYGAKVPIDIAKNIVQFVLPHKQNLKRSNEEIMNEWEAVEKKYRYKPLDAVYNVRRTKVEKDLKDQLKETLAREGYEAEVFLDPEKKAYKVKLKAAPGESNEQLAVNWQELSKIEEWVAFKPGTAVEYKTEGPQGEVIMYSYKDKKKGTVQAIASKKINEDFPEEPIMAFDLENNKFYSKVAGDQEVTVRELTGNDSVIEKVFSIKGNETIKEMSVVKGKLLCLVGVKGGGELLYVDGKTADYSVGQERILLDKKFDVNSQLVYGLQFAKNLQMLKINGVTSNQQQFDVSPKGIVDIVPVGDDDFLAVGYLNKKPIAYTKDNQYDLTSMQQSDSSNGIRSVSVSEDGFTVIADYSDGEYVPFDKKKKHEVKRNLVDKKDFGEISLTASNNGGETVLGFSIDKGPSSEFTFPNKSHLYDSVKMVNGTPLLTVKLKNVGAYAIVPLYEFRQGGKYEIKIESPRAIFSSSYPQVLDQQDRVVVVIEEHGVLRTHEWKKEAKEKVVEGDEEVVLDVSELSRILDQRSLRPIDMLNAIERAEVDEMKEFGKEYRTATKESKDHSSVLAQSKAFIFSLNRMLKSDPQLFLDSVVAKTDRTDNPYLDSIIRKLVPEYKAEEKAKENGLIKYARLLIGALGLYRPSPKDYFGVLHKRDMLGGDPSEGNKERLFSVQGDETGGIYLTSTYFGFDNKSGMFSQLAVPIDNTPTGPTTELTGEILLGSHIGSTTLLPQRMGAAIIPERVKIVYKDGREERIPVEQSEDGQYFVRINYDKKMKSLVWSQEVPDAPYVPSNISEDEYAKTVKKILPTEKENQEKFKRLLEDPIVALPAEEMFFVQSIKDMSPKEKLYAIEAYVHSVCYYDWDNGEVKDKKEGLTPQEQLSFMQVRCKELAEKNKTLAVSNKRYAGVCADFGVLTTALMRSASLVAGVGTGAVVRDGVATVAQAHAVSVTPWPEGSSFKLTYIDGTPTIGLTEEETKKLAAIRFPTLREREKMIEQVEEKYKVDSERMIKELEERLEAGEDFAIEELQNGELEKMLNVVLKYEIEPQHTQVIEGLLNAVRYSGLPVFSEEIDNQIVVKRFLEAEIKRERSTSIQVSPSTDSGTHLFDISREYVSQDGINNLSKVIKLVEPHLQKTERRALMLLVKYLKAEKMKR